MGALKDEIGKESDFPTKIKRNLCVYVTGSYGRMEATNHSDIDLFFMSKGSETHKTSKISIVDKALVDASVIKTCRRLEFPEFSGGGAYLNIHYLKDILSDLGSPLDDYRNYFTARMLLLLESQCITNQRVYEQCINEIIDRYFVDFPDHEKDFSPVFLVNDIHRFWRTLCLNYEHKRNRRGVSELDKNKSHLQNYKLKYSRLVTCFSMIIPILSIKGGVCKDQICEFVYMTPMDRLDHVAREKTKLKTLVADIKSEYEYFQDNMNKCEDEALSWISIKDNRDEVFDRARTFGRKVYNLASEAPDDQEKLRYLIV
jgi:predicted nucleotidyltransferase